MISAFRPALVMLLLMTLLTGVAYPLAVTGLGRVLFPHQASGSLVERGTEVIGSTLIAQGFASDGYFWPRPSAAGKGYDATSSSGSNLGPTSKALLDAVKGHVDALQPTHPGAPVPVDLVTSSGSGLDPHISPEAAEYQVARVAKARGLSEDAVRKLVAGHIEGRTLGVLGEPRVNVLELNLALNVAAPATVPAPAADPAPAPGAAPAPAPGAAPAPASDAVPAPDASPASDATPAPAAPG